MRHGEAVKEACLFHRFSHPDASLAPFRQTSRARLLPSRVSQVNFRPE
jgi:hypothetical protein